MTVIILHQYWDDLVESPVAINSVNPLRDLFFNVFGCLAVCMQFAFCCLTWHNWTLGRVFWYWPAIVRYVKSIAIRCVADLVGLGFVVSAQNPSTIIRYHNIIQRTYDSVQLTTSLVLFRTEGRTEGDPGREVVEIKLWHQSWTILFIVDWTPSVFGVSRGQWTSPGFEQWVERILKSDPLQCRRQNEVEASPLHFLVNPETELRTS